MYYIYIVASKRNGTLYIGSTSNLIKRILQHKEALVDGFTKKYEVRLLVYYEEVKDAKEMVLRERQLKKWKREWKIKLIERENPAWIDLYTKLL